jgi:N-acetyl-gamma-glutamyl-phosphate reductase
MKKINVGILGAAGYTGGELIRLLIHHPFANLVFAHSRSQSGKSLHAVHADLFGETEMTFTDQQLIETIDVLFLCLGHGESKKFLEAASLPNHLRVIDLTTDFRHRASNQYQGDAFVYGLPELNKSQIRSARFVANPGCFATAIQLGLLPLAANGPLSAVHTTGITGSTGAGQSLSHTTHFSWRANNIQAYKTLEHQHGQEIGESLLQVCKQENIELNFVPWRGDFTRGIFISSTLDCDLSAQSLKHIYSSFYAEHPFTHLSEEPIFLKQVVNTNKALIQLEKVGSKLVVHSAIDNLLKGASGQAVQNMNLMFDLPETAGLQLKASYF